MPTWTIEYPLLLQEDNARFYEDISLLRNSSEVISCNYSEREDRPAMMVTVAFMGAGPSNPLIQQIVSKGTLQVPVNMWFPMQVSRLTPGSDGEYTVSRGRLQHGIIIFDDAAHFESRTPESQSMLHNGMQVRIDPATGLLVPSADNPIGMITGVDLARPDTDMTVLGTFTNFNSSSANPEIASRTEIEGYPPRTELTVLPADEPSRESAGFIFREYFNRQQELIDNLQAEQPTLADTLGTPRRVDFPTFEIQSNPQINLTDIRTRQPVVFDHSRRMVEEIQAVMDHQILEDLAASQGVTSMGTPETFIRRTRFEKILDDDIDYPL